MRLPIWVAKAPPRLVYLGKEPCLGKAVILWSLSPPFLILWCAMHQHGMMLWFCDVLLVCYPTVCLRTFPGE